ncbi:SPOR domain-containing protein [Campylobacter sp. RM16704]|uniref:SPOR domain-containing protein n=1 Tax=Campylobacter sp. RM16704 TaxID=1500960 RepID=UPI00057ED9F3|nr:SPOR domain-containing protein [Campylobacter sp. RM16704]AJC86005.1 putative protein (sporulation domain) [Campylobacter sp. RM16704]
MEENKKNEFDDIILQKSNKSEKLKKILLRSIILVIVFLVVMIVMKLINNPSEDKTLQMPAEPQNQGSYDKNFNSLPITDNKEEDEFEALARKLKEENALVDSNITIEEKKEIPTTNNSVLDQISTIEPKEEIVQNEAKQEENKKEEKSLDKVTSKSVEKPKTKTTEGQKKSEQASTSELFENITTNTQTQLQPGAYIQVFSLNNLDPKSKELNILKSNGYEYKIYKTNVNGKELTKVLVGPYKESDLKAELEKVRSKITKGAFTFRIK